MASVSSTPLDVVWDMSLAQFVAYYKELPEVMKLTNPWGGGGETAPVSSSPRGAVSTPSQIEATFASMGIKETNG